MNIAICDDEVQVREQLTFFLQKIGDPTLNISLYDTAEALIVDVNGGIKFDLIYFDILIPGLLSGMDAAQLIRKKDFDVMMIFITNYSDFMSSAFSVEAMDFLVKPIIEDAFYTSLQRCQRKYTHLHRHILFQGVKKTLLLTVQDVYYLEVRRNYIDLHHRLEQEPLQMRLTMAEAERLLNQRDFFRCHSSFLINLAYARELVQTEKNQYTVCLHDGYWQQVLAVSRNRWKDLQLALHDYRRGRGE